MSPKTKFYCWLAAMTVITLTTLFVVNAVSGNPTLAISAAFGAFAITVIVALAVATSSVVLAGLIALLIASGGGVVACAVALLITARAGVVANVDAFAGLAAASLAFAISVVIIFILSAYKSTLSKRHILLSMTVVSIVIATPMLYLALQ
ncbi:hypothetical protein H6761_01860 [Candidatus Nomurabacteria bacterium]|nr:hypothetical protein [Candidatus Nomurabacteria bacterium]